MMAYFGHRALERACHSKAHSSFIHRISNQVALIESVRKWFLYHREEEVWTACIKSHHGAQREVLPMIDGRQLQIMWPNRPSIKLLIRFGSSRIPKRATARHTPLSLLSLLLGDSLLDFSLPHRGCRRGKAALVLFRISAKCKRTRE
jgi:hypothetical protein